MTNFEFFKSMSLDELAEALEVILSNDVCLAPNTDCSCDECKFSKFCDLTPGEAKKWLNKEAT